MAGQELLREVVATLTAIIDCEECERAKVVPFFAIDLVFRSSLHHDTQLTACTEEIPQGTEEVMHRAKATAKEPSYAHGRDDNWSSCKARGWRGGSNNPCCKRSRTAYNFTTKA